MYKKTPFKFLRISFLLIGSILSLKASDIQKGSLFEAMQDFAEGNIKKAAPTFLKYGWTCPIAKPFCEWLEQKGYKVPGEKPILLDNHTKQTEANKYFEAALQVKELRSAKQQKITKLFKEAKDNQNGPLLFVIGDLYEKGTKNTQANKEQAKECYVKAASAGDVRGFLAAYHLNPTLEIIVAGHPAPLERLYSLYKLTCQLGKLEGLFFYDFGAAMFKQGKEYLGEYFKLLAAEFGYERAQLEMGQSHSADWTEALFWLSYAASHNNLTALNLCGTLFQKGQDPSQDLSKAFHFFKRAAGHAEATAKDFYNLAAMYEGGQGTAVNLPEADQWFKKAVESDPMNQNYKVSYGNILVKLGKSKEALEYLAPVRFLNDEARYTYALALEKQESTNKESVNKEALEIIKELASKGDVDAVLRLAFYKEKYNINFDTGTLVSLLEKIINFSSVPPRKRSLAYYHLADYHDGSLPFYQNSHMSRRNLLKQAVDLNPVPKTQIAYALALQEETNYQEALTILKTLELEGRERDGIKDIYGHIGFLYVSWSKTASNPEEKKKLERSAYEYLKKQVEYTPQDCAGPALSLYIHLKKGLESEDPATPENILKYLKISANQDNPGALSELGNAYYLGFYNLTQDLNLAETYWRKSVALGGPVTAKIHLAQLLLFDGLEEREKEGFILLKEISQQDPLLFKEYLDRLTASIREEGKDLESTSSLPPGAKGDDLEAQEEVGAPDLLEESEGVVESEDVSVQQEMRQLAQEQKQLSLEKKRKKKIERQASRSKKSRGTDSDASEGYEGSKGPQASTVYESSEEPGTPRKTRRQRHQEQITKEQAEKTERKLAKLKSSLEQLKAKNIEKYRKVKKVMGKHITLLGGQADTGKGSGRSYKIAGQTKGYHSPHGGAHGAANIKAGSFKGIVETLEEAHESRSTSKVSENALPEQKNS